MRITRSLGQALNLLKFSNRELAAFLAFQEAANPHLALRTVGEPPDRSIGRAAPKGHSEPGGGSVEWIASAPVGLYEHARREIGLVLAAPRERAIAERFIEALEPTGWLGRSAEDIAHDCGCSAEEALTILKKIQQIDPPGLFARSLAECLKLQAEHAEVLTDELACLLDNLPMLARGEFDELAKLCACSRKDIAAHFVTIRSFNPKPGLAFGADPVGAAPPDLIVAIDEDGIRVDLNRSTLPTVTVDDRIGLKPVDRKMLDAAKAVARAVERRNISTLQIASEIVRRQSDFLRTGPKALRPLTLREVADAIGVHESTVSRVTAGLRMDTPRGPIGLRDFFSSRLSTSGDPVSAVAVRTRIRAMIESEDPSRPVSDAQIVARLSGLGVQIARRTVTKYREMLRIPGAADRKRRVAPGRGQATPSGRPK